MDVRTRYWNMLVQFRFENFYLTKYLDHSHRWEKGINIFLAITSAPVIAAWAIWKIWNVTEILWVCLVGISQVINAIRPFFPVSKRIEAISKTLPALNMLSNEVERDWFFVAEGELTPEEVNQLIFIYMEKYENVNNSLDNVFMPDKSQLKAYADNEADDYCRRYFSREEIERCRKAM